MKEHIYDLYTDTDSIKILKHEKEFIKSKFCSRTSSVNLSISVPINPNKHIMSKDVAMCMYDLYGGTIK